MRFARRALLALLVLAGGAGAVRALDLVDLIVRLAPITIAGAPRSLVTFAIAVPVQVESAIGLRYLVEMRGATEVLGRLEGDLPVGGRKQIVLTLRVPADARVGLLDVADVVFRGDNGEVVVVPIILRVPAVRVMRITAPPMYSDLLQGDRVELAFRVQNLGNAPEQVEVQVTSPTGWLMRTPRTMVVQMEPFGTREVNVRLAVPAAADGGDYYISGAVRPRDGADSAIVVSSSTRLQVRERETRAPGLNFTPFVAAATTQSGTSVASGFGLNGPIADDVRLSLHVLPFASSTRSGGLGLAGVGAVGIPVQATLYGNGWTVSGGSTSARISDLTGINVVGVGAQGSVNRGGREALVVASRPFSGTGQTGEHLGAGAWVGTELGRIGGSASRLRESYNGVGSRELTALGADWTSRSVSGWVFDGGLALRHFDEASHLGYRVQALRETDGERLRVRFAHAPGGSRAFASAVDNLELDYRRALSARWAVDLTGMANRDAGPVLGASRNHSFSVGQQYQLGNRTSLRVRALTSAFSTQPLGVTFGRFGSSAHSVTGGAQFQLKRWDLSTDLRFGVLGRESELFSGAMSTLRVAQQEAQVTVSRGFEGIGHLTSGAGATLTGEGMGMPREALNAFVGIGGVNVPFGPQSVRFNSRLSYIGSSLQRALVTTQVSAVTTLPGGFDIMATVERNPFFRNDAGRATWMAALRVTASTTVFVPRQLTRATGVVFEDLNGNGKRDAGEAGVPGVVLRQSGIRIVTEADGVYRVPANVRGRLQVDPLGLPTGFVPSPQFSRDLAEHRDIPLIQTGSLTVELSVAADAEGRRPAVDLANAQVWLRDAQGNDWVGRASAPGQHTFENVPVGRYSFGFDLSRLSEAMRSEDGALAEVAAKEHRTVTVTLRGRNIRMIVPPERGRGGTGRTGTGRNDRGALP